MPAPSSFMEIVFPENVSYGAVGGQGWSTRVVVTDAGYEYRQQLWAQTRGRWVVGHNLRSATEWATLIAFHRLALGRTMGFRFKDWTDYTDGGTGGLSQNASGLWQLTKTYSQTDLVSAQVYTSARLISKPRPTSVAFSLNGTPYTFVASTLDYTTGVVTFRTGDPVPGVGNVYTWTGNFDLPARFDTDDPQLSVDLPTAVGWRGIPIVELRMQGQ